MRLGSLNAGLLTSSGVSAVDPSVMALQVPMLYSSYEEVDHVLSVFGPKLEASMASKGFVVLNWADAGWVRFFTKTPVRTPDELKPLKLFAWGNDTDYLEIWKEAGFNPVPAAVDRDLDGPPDRPRLGPPDDADRRPSSSSGTSTRRT